MVDKVLVSWSGGKDSALALYEVLKSGMDVEALLTTVTREYDRVSIHGFRRLLLKKQAESLGFPVEEMMLSKDAADKDYEKEFLGILQNFKNRGVVNVVFGDIFLQDVKNYREVLLAKIRMQGICPLWKQDTRDLANHFVELGFKAVVSVVDSTVLGEEFVGREYDKQFLADLPPNVDPCGENGEFHTFAYNGPLFTKPVDFNKDKTSQREGRFWYTDLVPT